MASTTLIDYYLPDYDFNEVHTVIINQPAEKVYPLIKTLDFSSEKIITALFKLRRLPVTDFTLDGLVNQMNFTWLAEKENKELLIALWGNTKPERIPTAEAFRQDNSTYNRKIAWNFLLEPLTVSSSKVSTETRIKHYTTRAKIVFSLYWFFIRPFSGLIRILMLQKLKRKAEGKEESGDF